LASLLLSPHPPLVHDSDLEGDRGGLPGWHPLDIPVLEDAQTVPFFVEELPEGQETLYLLSRRVTPSEEEVEDRQQETQEDKGDF